MVSSFYYLLLLLLLLLLLILLLPRHYTDMPLFLSSRLCARVSLTFSLIFHFRFFAGHHSPCSFPFDGAGKALAHAFFPEDGIVHFDDDETYTDGVSTGTNLFSVALHEIGHVLGLAHSQHSYAIMHQTYKAYDPNMNVTDEEKHGIDYIYGE